MVGFNLRSIRSTFGVPCKVDSDVADATPPHYPLRRFSFSATRFYATALDCRKPLASSSLRPGSNHDEPTRGGLARWALERFGHRLAVTRIDATPRRLRPRQASPRDDWGGRSGRGMWVVVGRRPDDESGLASGEGFRETTDATIDWIYSSLTRDGTTSRILSPPGRTRHALFTTRFYRLAQSLISGILSLPTGTPSHPASYTPGRPTSLDVSDSPTLESTCPVRTALIASPLPPRLPLPLEAGAHAPPDVRATYIQDVQSSVHPLQADPLCVPYAPPASASSQATVPSTRSTQVHTQAPALDDDTRPILALPHRRLPTSRSAIPPIPPQRGAHISMTPYGVYKTWRAPQDDSSECSIPRPASDVL
ncbi:hypothetical protein C8J57DRAFT_1525878 [Mycena rebaudengoi]|nr:hypothetical protein C8J57DRAFT_1525878 [Mycena rebaudengoi]